MTISFSSTSGTYAHSSGTAEQTAFTFSPSANNICKGIWLDLTNLTQSCTIRVKYQVDGTNYRTFQTISWTTGMDDGVLIDGDIPVAASKSLRVTFQSGTTEGASRDIAYEYWTEGLGSGLNTFTYTVTNSVSSTALAGIFCWVSTDSAGSNIIASGTTNSSGQVVFYLSSGTYYIWRNSSLFSFENPDIETIP